MTAPDPHPLPAPLPTRPVADPAAVVAGETYRITVLTDGLLRLEYAADGRFEDRASAFATVRDLPVPDFDVVDDGGSLEVITDRVHLVYDRRPFSTSGLQVAVRGGISSYHSVWRFGEPPSDLGGTARTLDLVDGRIDLEPGVVSRQGFSVVDDSRTPTIDEDGRVAPRDGSRIDLYVFGYGHDYREAVAALFAISGRPPVLPRWALGNWWSRYFRYTADGYTALMDRFADEGIPFAVSVIDMDWHLVDIEPRHGSGWTGYTWNRELFPAPARFLADLHERGLRVTLNVHPADGVRAHEDAYPAMAAALGRDPEPGRPIAFDVTDRDFLAAYFGVLHRELEQDGVDFWWLDWQSGPHSRVAGIDPLWMLNHFHFQDNRRGGSPFDTPPPGRERRPLTFSRYAGPGSHRYPVGFSGDALITWASLDFQPEFTATAANIGYGWWSHDIGGHMMGVHDDELATRWVQFGCFAPILRLHSGANPFITKEPWSFPAEHAAVMTAFLRLRHRLVPYLHTMNQHAARTGDPLVTPMYWEHPERAEAYQVPNQFRFGTELIVAPITTPADPVTGLGAVRAWLPPGSWVDLLSGRRYAGDREIVLHRDLAQLPVLAAPGSIVVLDAAAVPANDPVNPQALEVVVVAGADGGFELIEDDGFGDGLDERFVARTGLVFDDATGILRIAPTTGCVGCVPGSRDWTVSFLVDGRYRRAVVRGVAPTDLVEVRIDDATSLGPGDDAPFGGSPVAADPGTEVFAEVFAVLHRARYGHDAKVVALAAATSEQPVAVRLSRLAALDLPPSLLSAIGEVLTAQ